MGACTPADQGFASGAIALSRSFFGVLGIAILGTLLAATMAQNVSSGLSAMNAPAPAAQQVIAAVHHGGAFAIAEKPPAGVNRNSLMHVVEQSFGSGWRVALMFSAALTLFFGILIYAIVPARKSAAATSLSS
jgi:hypothetical protein